MPTSIQSFASAEIAIKWQEPYVSQGLLRAVGASADRGIHRGFRLATSGTALFVTVEADSVSNDHAAIFRTSDGYGVSLSKSGGNFTLNLTSFANKTIAVALYATYAPGATTTAVIRAYEISPSDEFTIAAELPSLVVLGTVVVPASGVISASSISSSYRTEAWDTSDSGSIRSLQLVKNGSFELSMDGGTGSRDALHWLISGGAGWSFNSTSPSISGDLRHATLTYAGAPLTASLVQSVGVHVRAGQKIRCSAKVRALQVVLAGTLQLVLHFTDTSGIALTSVTHTIPASAVDASYRTVDQYIVAPANAVALTSLEIAATGVTAGVNAAVLYLDEVQLRVDVEGFSQQAADALDAIQGVAATSISLIPDAAQGFAQEWTVDMARSLLMYSEPSNPESIVHAKRRDGGASSNPFLNWMGRIGVGRGNPNQARAHIETPHDVSGASMAVTLIWDSDSLAGSGTTARLYVHIDGTILFTVNAGAVLNPTLTWQKDTPGVAATGMRFGYVAGVGDAQLNTRLAANNANWLDSAWDTTVSVATLSADAAFAALVTERIDVLTVDHTWTPQDDCVAEVTFYGGGGSGAGGTSGFALASNWPPGAGGGGKAPVRTVSVACPAGVGVVCVIGAGGISAAANAAGNDGATSYFGSLGAVGGQGGSKGSVTVQSTTIREFTPGGQGVAGTPKPWSLLFDTTVSGQVTGIPMGEGSGGAGTTNHVAAQAGSPSAEGYSGGGAGGLATDSSTTRGGGAGGGGAGGAGGVGGAGGAGGNGNNAGAGGNGSPGVDAAANTGAGGGGGGSAGCGSTSGGTAAVSGAGGSGKITIKYRGRAAVIT